MSGNVLLQLLYSFYETHYLSFSTPTLRLEICHEGISPQFYYETYLFYISSGYNSLNPEIHIHFYLPFNFNGYLLKDPIYKDGAICILSFEDKMSFLCLLFMITFNEDVAISEMKLILF